MIELLQRLKKWEQIQGFETVEAKLFRKMLTFVSQLETVLTTLCQGLLRKSHLIVTLFRNKEI